MAQVVVAVAVLSGGCSRAPRDGERLPKGCEATSVALGAPTERQPVAFELSGGRVFFMVTQSRRTPVEFPAGNEILSGDDYVRVSPFAPDPAPDLKGVRYVEMRTGNLASVELRGGTYRLYGTGTVTATVCAPNTLRLVTP